MGRPAIDSLQLNYIQRRERVRPHPMNREHLAIAGHRCLLLAIPVVVQTRYTCNLRSRLAFAFTGRILPQTHPTLVA